ncbi:MAG: hypothetical protein WCA44_02000 [Acidobacteriaceae bacterium]
MDLTALDDLLWALGFSSSVVVLVIFLWRARYRRFPVFTAWIGFSVGNTILAFAVYRLYGLGSHLYAKIFWGSLWPGFVLQVGAVFELARTALRRNGAWVGDSLKLFLFAAACGVVVSALLSAWIVPPHGMYTAWELRADVLTSLVLCELLVSLSLIANWLSLAWDRHVLAIAEGLTVWSAVTLVVNAIESYLGSRYFKEIDRFQNYAWIGAMMWIAMEFGLPNATAESSHGRLVEDSSRIPEQPPSRMLRRVPGVLTAFRKLHPQAAPPLPHSPPPLSAAHPGDGVQP